MNKFVKALGTFCLILLVSTISHGADLQVKDLIVGQGEEAVKEKKVTVHYTGWLANGTKFDSSVDRNRPFQFVLGARQVIPGWDLGVQGMKVGGKRELIIPPEMAYGPRGAGGVIPPNATLRFEVELLNVEGLGYSNIDNEELKALRDKGVKVVDVRTPYEWKQTGVVEGSLLLPFRMENGRINAKFAEDLQRLVTKDEPVILICRTGNRTRAAAEMLSAQHGFENVYNVRHGITYWMRERNPTARPKLDNYKNTCSLC